VALIVVPATMPNQTEKMGYKKNEQLHSLV
jgi:hypothetical protein